MVSNEQNSTPKSYSRITKLTVQIESP